ncbi:MAG: branched-chain amino acid ABC transporter permease [bacterium]
MRKGLHAPAGPARALGSFLAPSQGPAGLDPDLRGKAGGYKGLMDIIIYGVVNSVSLALMALGFTLVYGISRLPNFAHGALYILAGYLTWISIRSLNLGYFISVLISLGVVTAFGMAMYRFFLIRIRGMPISEIIASYAMGLFILEGLRWKGLKGMTFTLPVVVPGSVDILDVPVDYQRLLVVVVGSLVVLGLWAFTRFTKVGLALRGIAQDEQAAMMLGIDSDTMATIATGLGSALAALAAIVLLPLGNIVVETGYQVLIFAVAVCIVGGLGSWGGAIVASFLIGFAQILTVAYVQSHFQVVVALLAIIITLIIRPSGLFGKQKQLEERV